MDVFIQVSLRTADRCLVVMDARFPYASSILRPNESLAGVLKQWKLCNYFEFDVQNGLIEASNEWRCETQVLDQC
jgi:hypothetical protein